MTLSYFSLNFDNLPLEEALLKAKEFLADGKQHYIVTPNPEMVVLSERDYIFREALWRADLSLIDGFGLAAALRILSGQKIYRNTGTDYLLCLFRDIGSTRSFFILGTYGDTAAELTKIMAEKYGTRIVGQAQPSPDIYTAERVLTVKDMSAHRSIINAINDAHPDILIVALGHNRQEKWMHDFLQEVPSVKLAMGVGGAPNYLVGNVSRAPQWMRTVGLEWLWRLFTEPHRAKRIFTATIVFPLFVVRWLVRLNFFYRPSFVGVVYNDQGEILLVNRADNPQHWQFPQGGAEYGESAREAIMREMREELGTDKLKITGQSKPNIHRYNFRGLTNGDRTQRYYGYRGQKQTIFFVKFLGQPEDMRLDSHEHLALQWVSPSRLIDVIYPSRRAIAQLALNQFHDYSAKN